MIESGAKRTPVGTAYVAPCADNGCARVIFVWVLSFGAETLPKNQRSTISVTAAEISPVKVKYKITEIIFEVIVQSG